MKIGINMHGSAVRGSRSALREQLNLFKDVGFDCVEISPGSLNLIRNGILDKEGCSSVLDILSGYDFSYTVHAPMKTNLASPTLVGISERIVRACTDFSVLVDAQILVLHSGYVLPDDKISESEALRVLANSLKKCAGYAGNSGVSIGIENDELGLTHLCRRIDWLLQVVKDVNTDNVGVTFDFGHAYIAANYYGFDFMNATREALPYVIHVHISDNFGKFDPLSPASKDLVLGYGDLHLPIGWGCIPYGDVLNLVKKDYKGIYLLEIDPSYRDRYRAAITNLKRLLE